MGSGGDCPAQKERNRDGEPERAQRTRASHAEGCPGRHSARPSGSELAREGAFKVGRVECAVRSFLGSAEADRSGAPIRLFCTGSRADSSASPASTRLGAESNSCELLSSRVFLQPCWLNSVVLLRDAAWGALAPCTAVVCLLPTGALAPRSDVVGRAFCRAAPYSCCPPGSASRRRDLPPRRRTKLSSYAAS